MHSRRSRYSLARFSRQCSGRIPAVAEIVSALGGGEQRQAGCAEARDPERGDEGAGLPMMMRRVIMDACPAATAAITAEQIRRYAAFIEKHEPAWVNRRHEATPVRPSGGDVGAILFGRAYGFF